MESVAVVAGEHVNVEVQGSGYEECITLAMDRMKEFVPDEPIFRSEGELTESGWFVAATLGQISQGGHTLNLVVAFKRGKHFAF